MREHRHGAGAPPASMEALAACLVVLWGASAWGAEPRPREPQPATPAVQEKALEAPTPSTAQRASVRTQFLKARAIRDVRPPSAWPVDRRWSPRRHFGPLYGSSPDLHLNGSKAAFVYGTYFSNHRDAEVFRKYYGPTLPSSAPTPPSAIPGTVPAAGFGDVRLALDRLAYSSRYGGSFELSFRSIENFQVEFRAGNLAWDIASLDALVYVHPVPAFFNPNSPLFSVPEGLVRVELRPRGVVGYVASANGLTVQEGDPLPGLTAALATAAQSMVQGTAASPFRVDAARFSHGLAHAAFWQEIGQTRKVTAAEISDHYFFPRTAPGLAVVTVYVQVANVRLDTESGAEEISVILDAQHLFQGLTPATSPSFSWELPEELDDGESTGWHNVGAFPLDWDCGQLQTVYLMVALHERDPAFDDIFDTDPPMFQTGALDCSGMQAAFDAGHFGLYRELPHESLLVVKRGSSDVAGALTARIRIHVVRQ